MPVDRKRLKDIVSRINTSSKAEFVKRLINNTKGYIPTGDGSVMTHRLGYVEDGDTAVVFPEVQSVGESLAEFHYPMSYERAVANGDTVQMSIPDAELFTQHYKEEYPQFKQYRPGGALGQINPNIVRNAVKNATLSVLPMSVSKGLSSVVSLTRGDLRGAPLKDYYDYGVQEDWNPEQGFLMSPTKQQKYMEEIGYHKVDDGSYGMVNRAATELGNLLGTTIPIYQLGDDDISPDDVELVSTDPAEVRPYFERLVNSKSERLLRDPGNHPSALYKDSNGNYYLKSWDLNDYGQHGRRSSGTTYDGAAQVLAELYDYIGTPFVQRTGLIRVPTEEELPVYDKSGEKAAQDFAELYRQKIANDEFSSGGSIHIKPENRGKFTALKKRTGHSATWFKEHGTPAQKKMATFALNARKWKHADGGFLIDEDDPNFVGPLPAPAITESDDMIMRQRYAESTLNDSAYNKGSKATGAFQITPVVLDEYLGRENNKGDLNALDYNRAVRDWYMNVRLPEFEMYRMGDPTDEIKIACKYAAYNAGPGAVRKALKKALENKQDINSGYDWLTYMPKETQDYVNFIVRGMDVPDSSKTAARYRAALALHGYSGGGALGSMIAKNKTDDILQAIQKIKAGK